MINGDWQRPTTIFTGGSTRENGDLNGSRFSAGLLLDGKLQSGQLFTLIPFSRPLSSTVDEFVVTAYSAAGCDYDGEYSKRGQLTLNRFTTTARIAAGQFAFTLYKPGGRDTLRVTDGRFDLTF